MPGKIERMERTRTQEVLFALTTYGTWLERTQSHCWNRQETEKYRYDCNHYSVMEAGTQKDDYVVYTT